MVPKRISISGAQKLTEVDIKLTHINEHLASLKSENFKAHETKELKAKESEDQLKFERAQFDQKVEYE